MMKKYVLLNIALAFILFRVNSFIGEKLAKRPNSILRYNSFSFEYDDSRSFKGNFFLKIVNPAILLALVLSILQTCNDKAFYKTLWITIIVFWIIRWSYIVLFKKLINIPAEILANIVSILLYIFILSVGSYMIENDKKIFITFEALKDGIWYAMIAYASKIIIELISECFDQSKLYSKEKLEKIVVKKYNRLYSQFDKEVEQCLSQKEFRSSYDLNTFYGIVYSIMIFEDYNRNSFIRKIENILIQLRIKKRMTLGIMQVESDRKITDSDSILIAINKLYNQYGIDYTINIDYYLPRMINDYNRDNEYYSEIKAILDYLIPELIKRGRDFTYVSNTIFGETPFPGRLQVRFDLYNQYQRELSIDTISITECKKVFDIIVLNDESYYADSRTVSAECVIGDDSVECLTINIITNNLVKTWSKERLSFG